MITLNFLDPRSFCFLKTRTVPPQVIAPSHLVKNLRNQSAEILHLERMSESGVERERGSTLATLSPGKAEPFRERRMREPLKTRRTLRYRNLQGPNSSRRRRHPEHWHCKHLGRKWLEPQSRKLWVLSRTTHVGNLRWWRNISSSLPPLMTQVGHCLSYLVYIIQKLECSSLICVGSIWGGGGRGMSHLFAMERKLCIICKLFPSPLANF